MSTRLVAEDGRELDLGSPFELFRAAQEVARAGVLPDDAEFHSLPYYDEEPVSAAELARLADDAAALAKAEKLSDDTRELAREVAAFARGKRAKYSDDQPRDDSGRWTSGSGSSAATADASEDDDDDGAEIPKRSRRQDRVTGDSLTAGFHRDEEYEALADELDDYADDGVSPLWRRREGSGRLRETEHFETLQDWIEDADSDEDVDVEDMIDAFSPGLPEGYVVALNFSEVDRYGECVVSGVIGKDAPGDSYEPVGHFVRTVNFKEGIVEHNEISILPEHQGKGLGTILAISQDQWYRKMGFNAVHLTAISASNDTVTGHQVWSLQGYDWSNPNEAKVIHDAFVGRVENDYGKASPEAKRAAGLKTAQEHARFRDDRGNKVGFKYMHLGQLDGYGEHAVPTFVGMVRRMRDTEGGSANDREWQDFARAAKRKYGKKGWKRAEPSATGEGGDGHDYTLEECEELLDLMEVSG